LTERFGTLIKDFTQWAEPLNQQIRQKAKQVTLQAGLKIEYLGKSGTDKEKPKNSSLRTWRLCEKLVLS
jgi:hypothetical protein